MGILVTLSLSKNKGIYRSQNIFFFIMWYVVDHVCPYELNLKRIGRKSLSRAFKMSVGVLVGFSFVALYIHSQGDEEEERYSAQQRGARPHEQYDKADRSALGTDMRRENFRGRE